MVETGNADGHAMLTDHRRVWTAKPVLGRLYADEFFTRLDRWAPGDQVLEVGAGPGFYKEHRGSIHALDIVAVPWIDVCGDCLALPFRDGALDAVVGLDVIHHLVDPVAFLNEVARALRPGGRLVLVEPWHTPLSKLIYTHFHQEDFDLSWSPDSGRAPTGDKPFDGNQAIPFLVFDKYWSQLAASVPTLRQLRLETFSFASYLMSGGFKSRSLLPQRLYRPVLGLERATTRVWRRIGAMRALVVLERTV